MKLLAVTHRKCLCPMLSRPSRPNCTGSIRFSVMSEENIMRF